MGKDFNNWTSYDIWQTACSQQSGCLSCPLSIAVTGKECYSLTREEIEKLMKEANAK